MLAPKTSPLCPPSWMWQASTASAGASTPTRRAPSPAWCRWRPRQLRRVSRSSPPRCSATRRSAWITPARSWKRGATRCSSSMPREPAGARWRVSSVMGTSPARSTSPRRSSPMKSAAASSAPARSAAWRLRGRGFRRCSSPAAWTWRTSAASRRRRRNTASATSTSGIPTSRCCAPTWRRTVAWARCSRAPRMQRRPPSPSSCRSRASPCWIAPAGASGIPKPTRPASMPSSNTSSRAFP